MDYRDTNHTARSQGFRDEPEYLDDDIGNRTDYPERAPDGFDDFRDELEEYAGDVDILGPDPDTGQPRIEIILDPLIQKAHDAAKYLEGILINMKLSGRIGVTTRNGTIYLEILGAEPGLVIGHRGQNLDALQHLINRMVNRDAEDLIPVTVDSDDYRHRRHQQLLRMVRSVSQQVLKTGQEIITEPLTPSERRLFHIAANRLRGVRTVSFGSGFFQPIKVFPIKSGTAYPDRRIRQYPDQTHRPYHDDYRFTTDYSNDPF